MHKDRIDDWQLLLDYFAEEGPKLLRPAKGVLRHPSISATLPGASYSTQLWDWDTYWTARGLFQLAEMIKSQELCKKICVHAQGSLANFFECQSDDGRIPIMIDEEDPDPFGCLDKQNLEMNQAKPVFAQIALLVADVSGDVQWLEPQFDCLLRFYDAWINGNMSKTGLLVWGNDVAVAVDNDPAIFGRPPFSSAGLMLNCLFYQDLLAAAELAGRLGRNEDQRLLGDRARMLGESLQQNCWDRRDGFFYNVDVQCVDRRLELMPKFNPGMDMSWNCLPLKVQSFSGFLPLWCGLATADQADVLVNRHVLNDETFHAAYGVRTLAKDEAMYSLVQSGNPSNWLGPIWTISNYMVWKGLASYGFQHEADELAEATVRLLASDLRINGSLNEYYHPDTGAPLSHTGFMDWNLLVLEMMPSGECHFSKPWKKKRMNVSIDLTKEELRKKILGCWTGKNIGGTLGGPYEGIPGTHSLTFYDPVPTEPLPNDDLDLQVLFLEYLLENYNGTFGPDVLRQAWVDHCVFPWDEYGICQRNSELGLSGADVGAVDNWFADGMGAAIRTELWACLAPGDPERAAGFAWADAVCDHCGDGVWATVFISAMEAKAFIESDKRNLIECGLSYLPEDTRVSCAVRFVMQKWDEQHELMTVRDALVERFGTTNFTDVAANMGIIVLAWLAGEDDFGKSICHAVNCGLDTDCTCATLGSIFGIIDPDSISDEWKAPVGEEVKLSPEIVGIDPPADLNELTERTLQLSELLKNENPVIGDVKLRQMGGHPISLTYEQVADGIFDQNKVESVSLTNKATVPGHWFDAAPLAGDAEAVLLNLSFELKQDTAVRVMTYYRDRAKLWVDGESYAEYEPSQWFEGYHGPSFHRFQDQAPSLPLSKGKHSLMVALKNKTPGAHDVVIGVGDAEKNLWISNALIS